MEAICAEAVEAATTVLREYGIVRPAVVVNFAWKEPENGEIYAVGTRVPKRWRRMMADSLAESAEEAAA